MVSEKQIKRRRLYEGFGMLEQVQEKENLPTKKDINSVEIVLERSLKQSLNSVGTEFVDTTNSVEIVLEQSLKQSLNSVEQLHFNTIVGKEREFLFYIAYQCQKTGSLITENLTSEQFKKDLNYSTDGLKTVIYRLTKKSILKRNSTKIGRSGWVKFELTKENYNLIIKHKEYLNTIQTRFKHPFKESLNGGYNNNEYINKNTNTEEHIFSIADNLSSFGIGQKQLNSILKLNELSSEDIQLSLDNYSYDLQKNKIKANLNLFFGILRKKSQYISQEYSQNLEQEISKELKRIQSTKELEKEKAKMEMMIKYESYKIENPHFLEQVKNKQKFQVSGEVLENIAFQEFTERNQET